MNLRKTLQQTTEHGLSLSLQVGKAGEYITCAKLLMQGYSVSLAEPGLPYDILIDLGEGKFGRMQVKTTMLPKGLRQDRSGKNRHSLLYRFLMKIGRSKSKTKISLAHWDYIAFVALDISEVAFMKLADVRNQNGECKRGMEFKSRKLDNSRKANAGPDPSNIGKFIEDFNTFLP